MSVLYRNIVFTLNNPTKDERRSLRGPLNSEGLRSPPESILYLIYGMEKGESGTPHLQGYAELEKRMRFNAIKALPGFERMHIEPRFGTQEEAINYCMKDGKYWEYGKKRNQGERSDLKRAVGLVAESGMRAVVTHFANPQQHKAALNWLEYCEDPRTEPPQIYYVYAPTGWRKSSFAEELLSDLDGDVYWKTDGTKWWPGYDGQEGCIIDDIKPTWFKEDGLLSTLLAICDWHPHKIQPKGHYRQFKSNRVVFTSVYTPDSLVSDPDGEFIRRLISYGRVFTKDSKDSDFYEIDSAKLGSADYLPEESPDEEKED